MAKRSLEPLLWLLFSAGGVLAALLLPVLLFLFGLAFPLGWLSPPEPRAPAGRAAPSAHAGRSCSSSALLSLFHWAHRFRYTLYDGLQIKHLNEVINPAATAARSRRRCGRPSSSGRFRRPERLVNHPWRFAHFANKANPTVLPPGSRT